MKTFLFSSGFSEPCHVPFHVVFISVLLPVVARVHLLVMFLHSMLFFLTQRFIAPPVVSADPNHLLGVTDIHAAGDWGTWHILCMLVFHGLPFHANQCGLEGGTEIGVPSLGSCVPSTEELCLPSYLTQLLASLCSVSSENTASIRKHWLIKTNGLCWKTFISY